LNVTKATMPQRPAARTASTVPVGSLCRSIVPVAVRAERYAVVA